MAESIKEEDPSSQTELPPEDNGKVFNDPVHGHIKIPELCVKITDTPQFQRLRNIKQLGGCYFVYPGASHNRFEHSIGVCYLAGKLAKKLKSQQPELNISVEDVLCVQIAGLCHDLGHGPFSHLFDQSFIPMVQKDRRDWKHEEASVEMFRYLYKEHDLKNDFKKFNLGEVDLIFIEELINGPEAPAEGSKNQEWQCKGRPREKGFLYQIVANKHTGVDVDKWDYFARDCHHLGMKNAFDHKRLIKFARVLKPKDNSGQSVICMREKEVDNLYDMFYTRTLLHRRAYQHKTNKIIEYMIAEALSKADELIKIPDHAFPEKGLKMSKAIDDMGVYTTLDDSIYLKILHSEDKNLEPARHILERVELRRLYRYIAEAKPPQDDLEKLKNEMKKYVTDKGVNLSVDDDIDILEVRFNYKMKEKDQVQECHFYPKTSPNKAFQDNWKKTLKNEMERLLKERDIKLSVDNMVVLEVHFNYGMKKKDPLQKFYFYRKTSPNEAFQFRHDELSKMLPEQFSEDLVRIYWKEESEVTKDLTECIKEACKTIQLSVLWCKEVKESKKKDESPEANQAKCSAEESSSKEASEHEDQ